MKIDYKSELLTKEMYDEMDNNYQKRVKEINKRLIGIDRQSPEFNDQTRRRLEDLLKKKKNLLTAIKKLDDDYNTGGLSKESHEKLRRGYKDKVIEIMKSIDRIRN